MNKISVKLLLNNLKVTLTIKVTGKMLNHRISPWNSGCDVLTHEMNSSGNISSVSLFKAIYVTVIS